MQKNLINFENTIFSCITKCKKNIMTRRAVFIAKWLSEIKLGVF